MKNKDSGNMGDIWYKRGGRHKNKRKNLQIVTCDACEPAGVSVQDVATHQTESLEDRQRKPQIHPKLR